MGDADTNAGPSTTCIHPTPPSQPHTVPIPLTSVSSVGAPNASALLLYPSPSSVPLRPDTLARSLAYTLTAYPQLCGRLRRARPDDPGPAYTRRHLRAWLQYGQPSDPGFAFEVGDRADALTAALMPQTVPDSNGVVDFGPLCDMTLAPSLAPQLTTTGSTTGTPIAGVRLTRFADGGVAMCVAASHLLFDAGALGTLVEDWARVHVAMAEGDAAPPLPSRPFDPAALDARATGDLDASDADPALVQLESTLDVFRYDLWARDPEGGVAPPQALEAACRPSPEVDALDAARGRPRGPFPPWEAMSTSSSPLKVYGLDFSAADIERIATTTRAQATAPISAQDAFAAHLWRLIVRARSTPPESTAPLDFSMACDSRRRLSPPLDDTAPGCFNVCLGMQASAADLLGSKGAGWAAARIRAAIQTADRPGVLAAWLHKRAHDLDPTREWIVFPGNRSVCATNWARSAVNVVDFGGGGPAVVHNLVNAFGGYVTIVRLAGGQESGKWYEPGVRAVLWLEEEAMGRMLVDPELRLGVQEDGDGG